MDEEKVSVTWNQATGLVHYKILDAEAVFPYQVKFKAVEVVEIKDTPINKLSSSELLFTNKIPSHIQVVEIKSWGLDHIQIKIKLDQSKIKSDRLEYAFQSSYYSTTYDIQKDELKVDCPGGNPPCFRIVVAFNEKHRGVRNEAI